MSDEKKVYDNSGVLFRNTKKQQPQDADYDGSITVAGVEYKLWGRIKEKNGTKFFALSCAPKRQPAASPPAQQNPSSEGDAPF